MSLQRTLKRQRRLAPRKKGYEEGQLTGTQTDLFVNAIKDGGKAVKEFWRAHDSASFREGKPEKMTPKKIRNRSILLMRAGRLISGLLIRATGAATAPLRLGEIAIPKGFDKFRQGIYERGTSIYTDDRRSKLKFKEEIV